MTGVAQRTAYRILRRFNMHRLRELFPEVRPTHGIFRATDPGEVIQIDIKSASGLARGGGRRHEFTPRAERRTKIGWQYVHVAIDAASRRSYLEFLPGVKTEQPSELRSPLATMRDQLPSGSSIGSTSPRETRVTPAPTRRP